MTHPAAELQKSIFAALSSASDLTNIIGSGKIFDEVPRASQPPYVTFGSSRHNDWSTDTEQGMEHEIELIAWSKEKGRKEIYEIQQAILDAMETLTGGLQGHALINLTFESSQVIPKIKQQLYQGICTFRAVTEPTQ